MSPLLHDEASLLPNSIQLVSEGKLKKMQRKQARTTQKATFDHWQKNVDGEISVSHLLRLCGRLVYVPDSH